MSKIEPRRLGAGVVAVAAWLAELLFLSEQIAHRDSLPAAIWKTSAYLTDCATVAAGLVCTLIAVGSVGLVPPLWRAAGTMATLLVGVMFAAIGGVSVVVAQGPSSVLAHLVIPTLMTLLWVALPHGGLRWRHVIGMVLPVIGYLALMFARGALGDGYPYPFVDVPRVGWTAAVSFGAVVVGVSMVISTLLVSVDRAFSRPSAISDVTN